MAMLFVPSAPDCSAIRLVSDVRVDHGRAGCARVCADLFARGNPEAYHRERFLLVLLIIITSNYY